MSTDSAELARLLARHRPKSDGDGFPAWLRARVTAYVVEQRAQGTVFTVLRSQLGLSTMTLRRWIRLHPEPDGGGFAEVVVAEPALASTRESAGVDDAVQQRDIYLASPHGFRLHGLSLDQALAALAVLR